LKVVLGAHDFHEQSEVGRINVGVKEVIMHQGWNEADRSFAHDIAVLKFSDPIYFSIYIRPVCLPSAKLLGISSGQTVGWGHYDQKETPSNIANKIDINIIDDRECFQKETILTHISWSESFCGGNEEGGVCQGDSGSGYYVKKDGKFYLRGIVSSSVVRDCGDSHEAIYTDVFSYLRFLKDVSEFYVTMR
jgi:secreted trypsin-like serine protease